MIAADVMTRELTTVSQDASIARALRLMLNANVEALPVVDEECHLVGILTASDLLHRAGVAAERLFGPTQPARENANSNGQLVASIMTRGVYWVTTNTSLETVVHIMERQHVKRIPVLQDNRLVGIVSRRDLIRELALRVSAARPATLCDQAASSV